MTWMASHFDDADATTIIISTYSRRAFIVKKIGEFSIVPKAFVDLLHY